MSTPTTPRDRATILASLRDYVEQIREEALEGLSGSVASATLQKTATTRESAVAPPPPPSPSPPLAASTAEAFENPAPTELMYKYPGLEKTADLAALREFVGECTRCKLAPMRTNLVFGVGNPPA